MGALLEGGVDLIFLETFQDLDELILALQVKQSLHHCPAICSLAPNQDGRLPGGSSLSEAFARLSIMTPRSSASIVSTDRKRRFASSKISRCPSLPWPSFRMPASPATRGGRLVYDLTPASFAQVGASLAHRGARIVGGCCGTTPAHIAVLSKVLASA